MGTNLGGAQDLLMAALDSTNNEIIQTRNELLELNNRIQGLKDKLQEYKDYKAELEKSLLILREQE